MGTEEEPKVTVGSAIGQQAGSALPWECDWISSAKCLPLWEALPTPPKQILFGLKPTGVLIENLQLRLFCGKPC